MNRSSPAVLAALLVAPLPVAVGTPLQAQRPIELGPAVQVSAALHDEPHFEMLLAAHPKDPAQLIACSMLFRRAQKNHQTITYVTSDRGRTWRKALEVTSPQERESWDPACLYGPDGTAWSIAEGFDTADVPYVRLDRSANGGATWLPPRYLPHFERAFLAVDGTDGPRRGWLYLHGNESVATTDSARDRGSAMGVHVLESIDGPAQTSIVPSAGNDYAVTTGPGVVLSNGTFVGVFMEFIDYYQPDGTSVPPRHADGQPNFMLKVLRSEDGRTFTTDPVSGVYATWPGWASSVIPYLAADTSRGPFRDRLYIVWTDERSGRGEILLSSSADRGKTWSTPHVVNDDRPRGDGHGPDHFHPSVAVNPNGVVGLVWNDRRDAADNLSYSVRFTASHDGGETFVPSVKVSPEPHVPGRGARWAVQMLGRRLAGGAGLRQIIGMHSFNFSGGHTRGLAADAGGDFHALWVSNVTGVAQLWAARIGVPGRAEPNGGGRLAPLVGVSDAVDLIWTGARLTRATGAVDVALALRNRGADTLRGPVVVRVLDLRSAFGVPALRNAENGAAGAGAILDFTDLTDGGQLAPGATTRAKPLRFTVAELDTIVPSGHAISRLILMKSAVLARKTR